MAFQAPGEKEINEALGDIQELPTAMQLAIKSKVDESFQSMARPGAGDWLSTQKELGQTMKSFERLQTKAIPHSKFRTIYIQPFGNFDSPRAAPLEVIIEFVRVFFAGCEVEILTKVDFTNEMTHRMNYGIQYRTDGFYNYLNQTRSKRNTRQELLCVAVTMTDIYPDEDWNFVYGQARMIDGLGVYSFARLDPDFPTLPENLVGIPLTEPQRILMLRRCIKILLHEIGHLFGLKHCIYYLCLMNGANNEREMDRQKLYLCPVCLRKLYSTLKFNVEDVYEKFMNLCQKYGLEEERIWYQKRLDCIQNVQ